MHAKYSTKLNNQKELAYAICLVFICKIAQMYAHGPQVKKIHENEMHCISLMMTHRCPDRHMGVWKLMSGEEIKRDWCSAHLLSKRP